MVSIEFSNGIVVEGTAGDAYWGICETWNEGDEGWEQRDEIQYVCGDGGTTCRVMSYERKDAAVPVSYTLDWYKPGGVFRDNVIAVEASYGEGNVSVVKDRGRCYHSTSLLEPASLYDTMVRTDREGDYESVVSDGGGEVHVVVGKSLVVSWDGNVFGYNGVTAADKCLIRVERAVHGDSYRGVRECYNVDDGTGDGEVGKLGRGGSKGTAKLTVGFYEYESGRWTLKGVRHDVYGVDKDMSNEVGACETSLLAARGENLGSVIECVEKSKGRQVLLEHVFSGGGAKLLRRIECADHGAGMKCAYVHRSKTE